MKGPESASSPVAVPRGHGDGGRKKTTAPEAV